MKKARSSRSAYVTLRLFLVFALCLSGLLLGASAFGSWEGASIVRWVNTQRESLLETKLRFSKAAGGSKSPAWGTSMAPKTAANPVGQTSASVAATDPTITKQVNALGQTV